MWRQLLLSLRGVARRCVKLQGLRLTRLPARRYLLVYVAERAESALAALRQSLDPSLAPKFLPPLPSPAAFLRTLLANAPAISVRVLPRCWHETSCRSLAACAVGLAKPGPYVYRQVLAAEMAAAGAG